MECPGLATINRSDIQRLLSLGQPISFDAHSPIIDQGQWIPEHVIYIIQSGQVHIHRTSKNYIQMNLQLGPGWFFGHVECAFRHQHSLFNIKAGDQPTTCIKIPFHLFPEEVQHTFSEWAKDWIHKTPNVHVHPYFRSILKNDFSMDQHRTETIILPKTTHSQAIRTVKLNDNDYLRLQSPKHVTPGSHDDFVGSRSFLKNENMNTVHQRFEMRMAKLLHAEDAILTQSGYTANVGLIQTLSKVTKLPFYTDGKAHMSLRYSPRKRTLIWKHNDTKHLEDFIAAHGPGIIVVDSLYSSDGSIAPLKQLCNIAEESKSILFVDETHAFGCAEGGLGLCEELGISTRVHLRTISMSKAMVQRGGIVIGPKVVVDAFRWTAKEMIFSSAPFSREVRSFENSLDEILSPECEQKRLRLKYVHRIIKQELIALGWDVSCSDRQIIALPTNTEIRTMFYRDALTHRGVLGAVFCQPATKPDEAFVRFTLHAHLNDMDVKHVLSVFRKYPNRLSRL